MNLWAFRFLNDTVKNPVLDRLLPPFSDKDFVLIPAMVVIAAALYFGRRRARVCVVAALLALALSNVGVERGVKNLFQEPRPYGVLEGVHVFRSGGWQDYDPRLYQLDPRRSNAFPSSHASNVAALATVLAVYNPATLWFMVPLSLLVGLSRVYTGNHYPLDVLGGYAFGIACGLAMAWVVPRVWDRLRPARPTTDEAAAPMPGARRLFLGLLAAWVLTNFVFVHVSGFGLAGDEAQYWDWSRRPQLGYYSKPPMIAYVDRVFAHAGGSKEWALRSGAILFSAGALIFVYALALRIARKENAALMAALAAFAMPATWVGSVLMTVDPLLTFFWALAMYAFHRAVHGDRGMWWVTGLALGLGALSKYTMLMLVVSFALYLVLVDRSWLKTRWPYLALGLMAACLGGVVYWNAANDWVSLRHTASIGAGARQTAGAVLSRVLAFWGSQLGVVSPILFGLFAWAVAVAVRRFRHDRDAAYLALCFGVLFGFYALVSLVRKPEPNWPVSAYVAASVLLGWLWTSTARTRAANRLLAAALILGIVMGVAPRTTDVVYALAAPSDAGEKVSVLGLRFDPNRDPTNDLHGGEELGKALSRYVTGQKSVDPFIFSDRYQLTALAAFYTKGRPRAYCMNPGDRRLNQYDLWGGWDKLVGRDGLFITGGGEARAKQYIAAMVQAGAFARGEVLETVPVRRGNATVKTYTISRLYGYTGKLSSATQVTY